ncbi:hypothetical protein D3C85_1869210 [compost metagenome]
MFRDRGAGVALLLLLRTPKQQEEDRTTGGGQFGPDNNGALIANRLQFARVQIALAVSRPRLFFVLIMLV